MMSATIRDCDINYAWECLSAPSAEPMSITDAKLQARQGLDITDEDALIQRIIEGARYSVERDTRRAICWQRWKLSLDCWPSVIKLYRCPVIAVESVKYLNTDGSLTTMTEDDDYVVSYSEPCRISPAINSIWPSIYSQMDAVQVTFTAGYLIPFTASVSTGLLTFTDYVPTAGDSFRLTNSGGALPGGLSERTTYYVRDVSGSTCKLAASSGGSAIDLATPGSGLNFLGEVPQSLMTAMRKKLAVEFADREGSTASADCEKSYRLSLGPAQYVGAV